MLACSSAAMGLGRLHDLRAFCGCVSVEAGAVVVLLVNFAIGVLRRADALPIVVSISLRTSGTTLTFRVF